MDLIRLFSTSAYDTELTQGDSISGYTSALWVERYQVPGEFELKAPLSSGLMDKLPLGSFVSHIETRELMTVDNHEIEQDKAKDPMITISGRSFVSYLEERLVGQNHAAVANTIQDYQINSAPTWEQIQFLIYDHFFDGTVVDPDNSMPGVYVNHSCSGSSTSEHRHIKYGTIWERTTELLKIDDLGIRILRPTSSDPDIYFNIYRGASVADSVRFSWMGGDLDNLKYFVSNRKVKNFARAVGRWAQAWQDGPEVNFDRRAMMVDASDLDQQLTAYPSGVDLTNLLAALVVRANEALKAQKQIRITSADVSSNSRFRYRRDYNLGDLVTVDGDFGISQVLRVTEFAEIEDENGTSGHPTLTIPGE